MSGTVGFEVTNIRIKFCVLIAQQVMSSLLFFVYVNFKWVPCDHGMARPRVADRGDGLQIAANMLNKQ
jgi:hypothetical protein